MFYQALAGDFKKTSQLCAFCDINQSRMDFANNVISTEYGHRPVPTYKFEDFDKMIKEIKPDGVIVTCIDRAHHKYIIRAMELGCDAISEKPMTVDEVKCQEIIDTIKRTKKNLRVTFNYRYAPISTMTRDCIMKGLVGDVTSVHFEWLLDVRHGADYFRRWHRDKRNSGGLMVHKATHHFDLINWWIDSSPKIVFGMGDLKFYGRANAENRGVTNFYYRSTGSKNAKGDPFALDLAKDERMSKLYYKAEVEDGYLRDQSVFGDGISIEDTMSVMVRYKNNAVMTYSLNAYMPWEGYNVAINGTKGRLEVNCAHHSYINAGGDVSQDGISAWEKITVHPMHDKPYPVKIVQAEGGHGGGDPILLNDIFGTPKNDKYHRAAGYVDGAMSILTGIAANKSFATGLPVDVDTLVKF
jgi:predicted dehydrogenase